MVRMLYKGASWDDIPSPPCSRYVGWNAGASAYSVLDSRKVYTWVGKVHEKRIRTEEGGRWGYFQREQMRLIAEISLIYIAKRYSLSMVRLNTTARK